MKNKIKIITIIIFSILTILIIFYYTTGFLQKSKIDVRDIVEWERDSDDIIIGAKEFTLDGDDETCWYLIHGYTSTPDEMKEIAQKIHEEFNETVVVTRLKGNGELPSKLINLRLDDWYEQVSEEFDLLNNKYDKINLVGFSFGGALSTKLAQNKDVNNVYLLSPYLFATYKHFRIFKLETYLDIFANILHYGKKMKIGQINSKEGLDKHIAYWNMPFAPIKNSKKFFENVKKNLDKIDSPILLQQSKNDETSDIKSSIYIHENVSSKIKELKIFEKSNHIIVEDYDKEEVINNIINFEKQIREVKKSL